MQSDEIEVEVIVVIKSLEGRHTRPLIADVRHKHGANEFAVFSLSSRIL